MLSPRESGNEESDDENKFNQFITNAANDTPLNDSENENENENDNDVNHVDIENEADD